jgi:hypothetical protein
LVRMLSHKCIADVDHHIASFTSKTLPLLVPAVAYRFPIAEKNVENAPTLGASPLARWGHEDNIAWENHKWTLKARIHRSSSTADMASAAEHSNSIKNGSEYHADTDHRSQNVIIRDGRQTNVTGTYVRINKNARSIKVPNNITDQWDYKDAAYATDTTTTLTTKKKRLTADIQGPIDYGPQAHKITPAGLVILWILGLKLIKSPQQGW